ncbi:hypothetical protein CLOM_g19416 [Closterium sp. NIES-68]|nr:hypothetical protein CLOM_g19416 [Closterium sp. NIES-68]
MSVSLPGSDNVIAAVQKPRRDVSNKASSLKEDFAEYDADSVTSVSLPGSDNVIAAVRKPQRHVAATEPTSSFSVSLPGSDNEIVAFGVPARPVSSVVVVDASDEEAAEGEATPSRKSHSWKLFHSAAVTAASSASSASSVHPASDDTDSTFHVSLPGSDNEIWAAHVPHRESNVVVVTDESDRDATTTAIATITTAATTSTAATSTTPDDDTASVSLPGSDNVIEAFHIRGNKKKTTSFQVSLPGSDNVITAYGVPERKGMTVVATEGAEIAETAVAELAAVSEIAGAQATTEDVFTVSLPGSDNMIAALHVPHKRKFVVAQA